MAQPSLLPAPSPAPAGSAPLSPVPAPARVKSSFIVGPLYDGLFFIFSPLLALLLGWVLSPVHNNGDTISFFGSPVSLISLASTSFIHAHLFAVFFRSHGNQDVFRRFPWRFTVVPLVVLAAQVASPWLLMFGFVVAVIWDVYHSSMQNFGLGRIYDMKRGADPQVGRTLDIWMSHVLYIGPILSSSVTLAVHLEAFKKLNRVGSHLFDVVPLWGSKYQWMLASGMLGAGVTYTAYYIFSYVRLARRGVPVSKQKVMLYASTALVSLLGWGFNSFGEGFLIVNFFHALQYFAIVWWAEQENLPRLFRVEGRRWAKPSALFLFLFVSLLYGVLLGFGYSYLAPKGLALSTTMALVSTVALMHFWYDGFVWSVRKKAVPAA
ncbi:MAG TPA: hypothetical protein VF794_35920 [Archangium sp.]|jgi:hypothetical protein|uniref:hypothetical protein n=1 Tax=Archangium sp. TaxID=1872627 RepID=UPI002ED9BC1A